MDGTGLYEAVAAIFIAQLNNIELTIPQVVLSLYCHICRLYQQLKNYGLCTIKIFIQGDFFSLPV